MTAIGSEKFIESSGVELVQMFYNFTDILLCDYISEVLLYDEHFLQPELSGMFQERCACVRHV
jgi:hypothetical protein